MKLYEAICDSAGWQAYCERCGSRMTNIPGLGGSSRVCENSECTKQTEKERRESLRYISEEEP